MKGFLNVLQAQSLIGWIVWNLSLIGRLLTNFELAPVLRLIRMIDLSVWRNKLLLSKLKSWDHFRGFKVNCYTFDSVKSGLIEGTFQSQNLYRLELTVRSGLNRLTETLLKCFGQLVYNLAMEIQRHPALFILSLYILPFIS